MAVPKLCQILLLNRGCARIQRPLIGLAVHFLQSFSLLESLRVRDTHKQGHPDPFVVGIRGYAFRFDRLDIEAQAVLVDFQNAEFPKNMGEALRGVATASEEISIRCRTITLFRPQLKEQPALQNENVAVTKAAQPEENTFEPVLDEDCNSPKSTLRSRARFASFWRTRAGRFFGAGFVN